MSESIFAEGADWRIHYTVQGHGPNLILLHGGGPGATGASNYSRNIDALSKHFTTYVIDFPGWGQSSKNLDSFGASSPFVNGANALKLFMDTIKLEKAHLIGNSFGGSVAYYMALNYPERVDRLVTMGPGGAWIEGQGPTKGILQLLTYYFGEGPSREKLKEFISELVYDTSVITEALIEDRFNASNNPEILANPPLRPSTGPMPHEWFLSNDPRLSQMQHQSLLIWGLQDRVNLPAGAASFAKVPNQDLIMFGKCGHWAQWEQAKKFNEIVLWFLNRP
jgi:4,5:9,10-diseco-3-hydroxy-5,9,17-trioxoandrosta-1(10),2-diene-4-oate hydrolase